MSSVEKQAGFSLHLVIAAVVGVALLGVIVWRVMDANSSDESQSNNTTSNEQVEEVSEQSSTQTQTENIPVSEPYLEIKEFGIKIKLSEGIEDATYYYDEEFNSEYPDYPRVTVSTGSLVEMSNGECNPSLGVGPLGTVQKTSKTVDGLGNPLAENGNMIFKIGNDFVMIRTPQAPCSTDSEVEALSREQRELFFEAFKTVEAL